MSRAARRSPSGSTWPGTSSTATSRRAAATRRCLYWRDEAYTYREVQARANRFGNALRAPGRRRRGPRPDRPPRPPGVRLRLVRRGQGGRRDRDGQPAPARRRTTSTTSSTRGRKVAVVDESALDRIEPLRDSLPPPAPPGRGRRPRAARLASRRSAREACDRLRRTRTPTATTPRSGSSPAAPRASPRRAVHLQQDLPWNTERYAKQVMGIREDDLTVSRAQAVLRLRHRHEPAVPVRGRRRHRAVQRAQRAGDAVRRHRALPADHPHFRAHDDQRDAEPPRRRRRATSRRCASCSPRARRCPPSCTGAGRRPSGSRSWTASARPRCSTSTSRTTRATWCPGSLGRLVPGYEARIVDAGRAGRAPRRGGHALDQGRVGGHPVLAGPREVEGGPARGLGGDRRPHAPGRPRATSGTRGARTTC